MPDSVPERVSATESVVTRGDSDATENRFRFEEARAREEQKKKAAQDKRTNVDVVDSQKAAPPPAPPPP